MNKDLNILTKKWKDNLLEIFNQPVELSDWFIEFIRFLRTFFESINSGIVTAKASADLPERSVLFYWGWNECYRKLDYQRRKSMMADASGRCGVNAAGRDRSGGQSEQLDPQQLGRNAPSGWDLIPPTKHFLPLLPSLPLIQLDAHRFRWRMEPVKNYRCCCCCYCWHCCCSLIE